MYPRNSKPAVGYTEYLDAALQRELNDTDQEYLCLEISGQCISEKKLGLAAVYGVAGRSRPSLSGLSKIVNSETL